MWYEGAVQISVIQRKYDLLVNRCCPPAAAVNRAGECEFLGRGVRNDVPAADASRLEAQWRP